MPITQTARAKLLGGTDPTTPTSAASPTQPLSSAGAPPAVAGLNSPPGAPSAPPPPTPPPTDAQQYASTLGVSGNNATEIANNVIGDNHSAQISDPHAKETQDYLDMLKGRLGGMNSGEMLAEKEQGLQDLGNQTSQNLERYASIAGSRGVQGGANASLMRKALVEDNQGRASLERGLIMDNIAAKDRASQAYGGALQTATATGLDVGKYNAGATDRDTGLAMNLPFSILSGIEGTHATNVSDAATQDTIDIAKKAALGGSTSTAPAAPGTAITDTRTGAVTNTSTVAPSGGDPTNGAVAGNSTKFPEPETLSASNEVAGKPLTLADAGITARDTQEAKAKAKQLYLDRFPQTDMGSFQQNQEKDPAFNWAWEHGFASPSYMPDDMKRKMQNDVGDQIDAANAARNKPGTIICTESHRQGLLSDSEYRTTKAYGKRFLNGSQHAAYIRWATPIVSMMQKHPKLAKIVGAVVRHEVRAMRAALLQKKPPLFGSVVLTCVRTANFVFEKVNAWQPQTTTF